MPETANPGVEPPVDLEVFGRRMKAARIMEGYDRMTDLASAIEDLCGTSPSARTLYALERGEQMPTFEQLVCLIAVLAPTASRKFFLEAVREDLRDRIYGVIASS